MSVSDTTFVYNKINIGKDDMFKEYTKTIFILIGIQASGKTTFCQKYFYDFNIVSLDIIKTRKKEDQTIEFVSDLIDLIAKTDVSKDQLL